MANTDVNHIANAVELEDQIVNCRAGSPAITDDTLYHKGAKRPAPKFYGYKNPSTGPGDSCFSDISAGAVQYGHAMIMVLDNGAKLGSDFCADCNDGTDYVGDRYMLQWLNLTCYAQLSAGACYFRGSSTSPKACADAWSFAHSNGVDTSTGLTLVGFIYDGNGFIVQGEALQADAAKFKTRSEQIIRQLNTHKQSFTGLKPRRLAPRKDVFDPVKVTYDAKKNVYNSGDTSRNGSVEIGVWNGNLPIVLEKADKENTPVLIIFGVANCDSHWDVLSSDAFVDWQLSCNVYLSYCKGGWGNGGYSETWLSSNTYQAGAAYGSQSNALVYCCPEYAVHWKPSSGSALNVGKYADAAGKVQTGLMLDPNTIENFLSAYFRQYQPLGYSGAEQRDQRQSFSDFGKGSAQRVSNAADKVFYTVSVPYKNLDNIKAFCEKYDCPLAAIYYNSQNSAAGTLADRLNLGADADWWLGLEDSSIVWCDVANSDGGKAALGGEWQKWIANLGSHPERASDKWAFRFYSKFHGVDIAYSFQQVYDKVYDNDKAIASQNFITFLRETFEQYYRYQELVKDAAVYTVDFIDYDGAEIIPQQVVAQGGDAIPPSPNPSRAGYTFTGYSRPYVNVQQNLTCVAQYEEGGSSGGSGGYFAEHTYAAGSYQMKISNNLCAIQVVGDMRANGMTSQLTSVTFRQNLFQIMPSCFMNCEQLQRIDVTGQTKWIGDYAFYGCKNLTHVNALIYPKQTQINVIGAHAFQGTGLTDVAIDLTASYYDTGVGEQAFANCGSLKNVRLTNSAYLGRAAFKDCTALTSVSLPDKSSYAYPETFSGCTALSSISIPPKVWMLNDGMFRNCRALTAVDFQDPQDNRSQLGRLGAEVFSGCDGLTSLIVPSSITSLMQIDQNFLKGSSIRQITFNGLPDDIFTSGYTERRVNTVNGYITDVDQAKEVIKDALERHIPMVLITCKKSIEGDLTSDCSICKKLAQVLNGSAWQSYMSSNRDKCYFIVGEYYNGNTSFSRNSSSLWWTITDTSTKGNPLNGVYKGGNTLYAKLFAVYKDADGKVKKVEWSSGSTDAAKLIQQVDTVVSLGGASIVDQTSLSKTISKFGSPFDYVLAYSNTGKEYKLNSDSQTDKYVAPEVDTVTTSGFKTGVWYYNAKELKQYADDMQLPVFAEFSDYGCQPCIKFRTEIYERSEFQEWVAKQPYLFCRVETKNFGEFDKMFTQPYFMLHEWAKDGATSIPCFIFYWNREQNPVFDLFEYHDNQIDYLELMDMITQKFKS